jgi:signal transduction histidine kinase
MDTLINGLLRISRTGRSEMKVESINMEHLMNSIINTLGYQLEEANAKVELGPLPNCYGDKELLNQLFTNLMSNAIKYRAPTRPLRIGISAKEDFNHVRFMIEDNGIGIEERHLHRIWDVFFRVNFNTKDTGEGLGLSIVKRLAEKHFGKVWVTSQFDKGSIFYVELLRKPFTPESSGETK